MPVRIKGSLGSVFLRGRTWYIRVRRGAQGSVQDSWKSIATCPCGLPMDRHACPAKGIAQAALAKYILDEATEGHLGVKIVGTATLGEWLTNYLPILRTNVRSRPELVHAQLKRWATLLGSRALSDVDRADVENGLVRLSAGGASVATRNRYLAALSRCMEAAISHGFARENPCRGIRRSQEEETPIPWVSAEDLQRVVVATPAKYRPLVTVAAETGCRLGELLRLTVRDVDLDRGRLLVRRSKSGRSRELPLSSAAASALGGMPRKGRVFPFGAGTVSRGFPKWAEAAGVEGLTFHGLRHVFCSHLAQQGVPLPTVGALAGHVSTSTTQRYARHVPTGAAAEAVAALEAFRQPKTKGAGKGAARRSRGAAGG